MAVEWFCQLMGSEFGPYTAAQLIDLARRKRLTPEDLIRKGSTGEWVPAYRVKGLFEAAARPAPAEVGDSPMHSGETQTARVDQAASAKTNHLKTESPLAKPEKVLVSAANGHPVDPAEAAAAQLSAIRREWYCISEGQKLGPMPFERLQERAAAGLLHPTDRVWSNACPKWSKARDVSGLSFQD